MKKPNDAEAILYAFAMEMNRDNTVLEKYLRQYPELSGELIDLASELRLTALGGPASAGAIEDPNGPAAWQEFLGCKPQMAGKAESANLFARFKGEAFAKLADAMKVPRSILTALRGIRATKLYPSKSLRDGLMFNQVMFSSMTDEWRTPERLYAELNREFNFVFDPCPMVAKEDMVDGLSISWRFPAFCNPPYSDIARWVEKAYREAERKHGLVVMLIPSRTDTAWWHEYVMNSSEIRFIRGRLRFNDQENPAPFPSCLVVFKWSGRVFKQADLYEVA